MKKNQLLVALLLSTSLGAQALPITRAQARLVAAELVGIDDNTPDGPQVEPLYIFSRGAGQGFVIVSGDDSTAPILGYTEQGDYDEAQLPVQLRGMLTMWTDAIGQAQARRQAPGPRSLKARAVASYKKDWTDVAALVKTHWHQSAPYNDLAPLKNGQRCMTGCVATAGAQVTFYFRLDNPTELQYDTPTYSYGTPITESLPKGTPIEWDYMRLSGVGTPRQNSAVATLMYALGTSAWLTYGDGDGLATSGYNYKMGDAMRGQFHLDYQHRYKEGMAEQAWEELIYSNLKTRRPMLYSGYKEGDGGHSVVLDGYQAKTGLYHFNFGWGGQGDGWYTVDNTTGMNGFNQYQDLVYNITPQQQNLSGRVVTEQLFHKTASTLEVEVTNKGTLDYQGVYIYTNSQPKLPSQTVGADVKTSIEPGKTARLSFSVTPTTKDQLYVFLCAKNRRVLDTCVVAVANTTAALEMSRIGVDAGSESTQKDGLYFGKVNNTTANVGVTLTNGEGGTRCQPAFRCYLDKYNEEEKAWERVTNIIMNTTVFNAGQTQDVNFAFEKLSPGLYYRAYLDKPAVASTPSTIAFNTADSIVYFTVNEPSLTVTTTGRTAKVAGQWNAALFEAQATDASVCAYDITELTELNVTPKAPNPNALFYANADASENVRRLANVVAGEACQQLTIQTGADFIPQHDFTAQQASLLLADAEAGQWHSAVIPFAAQVPYGMQMKQPATWSSMMLLHQPTLQVEAMTPVLYLTGHTALNTVEAAGVSISAETAAAYFDGRLVASTVSTPVESTWLLPSAFIGSYYYLPADSRTEANAFEPYVISTTGTRMGTSDVPVTDAYYMVMSDSIDHVYRVLDGLTGVSEDLLAPLTAELKQAEDMFTYRSASSDADIEAQSVALGKALAAFLAGYETGVEPVFSSDNGHVTGTAAYYNLSGQPLQSPARRGLVIVRQGNTYKKVWVK